MNESRDLAISYPFEFEKWVCGEIGAEGMFQNPGERGLDAGIDSIIPFYHSQSLGQTPELVLAIVQVKGGKVRPDSVRALSATIREVKKRKCGIFVCFDEYMNTVQRNKEKRRINDFLGDFDFVHGFSVENLLGGKLSYIPGRRPV